MNIRRIAVMSVILASCWAACGAAEPKYQNGIYMTEADFLNDILSYPSLSDTDSLVEASAGDIHLIRSGRKLEFRFADFYGYRDRGHKFFSFGSKRIFKIYGYYEILDDTPLLVYNKRVPHVQYHYVQAPYFSLSLASDKYRLTKKNLKKYVSLTAGAEEKINAVKDVRSLVGMVHGKALVNEMILSGKD